MKIGDKVRFLNDVGGGTVTGFQGKDLVLVCTEDGFDLPTPIRECVVIETNEYNIAKRATAPDAKRAAKAAAKAQSAASAVDSEEESEENDRPITFRPRPVERSGADRLNLVLAFVPQSTGEAEPSRFDIFLINDCNYTIRYALSTAGEQGCFLIDEGEIEANTKRRIGDTARESLSRYERMTMQTLAYKRAKLFAPKPPQSVTLRVDATKFYRTSAFTASPFFTVPALLTDILRDDAPARGKRIDAEAICQAMTTPAVQPARTEEGKRERRDPKAPVEVDLHAHELLETMSGLQPKDILDFQLKTFNDTMQEHIKAHGRRIVFIHGKGEGVLRAAILAELKARYKQCRWQDASFREYGFGATMVTIP